MLTQPPYLKGSIMRALLITILVFVQIIAMAQEHPLSRVDSAEVIQNLNRYQNFIGKKDYRSATDALNKVAFTYWENNHYEEAIKYYEISLSLNEKVFNENGIAMINNNLGMLYSDIGRYELSLSHFTRTLAARKANKEPAGIISAEINISVVLNNLGRYKESIDHLENASVLAREMQDEEQLRSVYGMLSQTYEKIGNVEESIKYFNLYKSFHEEVQRKKMSAVQQKLAEERIERQQVEQEKLKQENRLLKKQLELTTQVETADSLNRELYDSLNKAQVVKQLLEEKALNKELEANAKAEENRILQREKEYLANITWIIVGTSLVVFILIIFIVLRIRKHNKTLKEKNTRINEQKQDLLKLNEDLQSVNEELRLSIDELNKTREKLVLSEKMASIGSVVAGIAHEINNSVNFIAGSSEMICNIIKDQDDEIKEKIGEDMEVISELEQTIKSGIKRTNSFISKLRSDGYKITRFVSYDLIEIMDRSINTLTHIIDEKKIKIERNYPESFTIDCIPEHIEQLIINIIDNAADAVEPENGKIRIDVTEKDENVEIVIEDNGSGIDETALGKIYDPFFTTKEFGSGTGLGLYMVYSYVASHHGHIAVDSEVNEGSRFKISLPIVQESKPVEV